MKQLDLFSITLEDQISDLKAGECIEFFRGNEKLVIQKHEIYKDVCLYNAPDLFGASFHLDEPSGLYLFATKINRWLEGDQWNGTPKEM